MGHINITFRTPVEIDVESANASFVRLEDELGTNSRKVGSSDFLVKLDSRHESMKTLASSFVRSIDEGRTPNNTFFGNLFTNEWTQSPRNIPGEMKFTDRSFVSDNLAFALGIEQRLPAGLALVANGLIRARLVKHFGDAARWVCSVALNAASSKLFKLPTFFIERNGFSSLWEEVRQLTSGEEPVLHNQQLVKFLGWTPYDSKMDKRPGRKRYRYPKPLGGAG